MKYFLILLLIAPLSLLAGEQEYNYKIKSGDQEYTFRTREDRWHVEAGTKLWNTEVMYRYADQDGTIENRLKLTTELFSYKDFTLEGRMEYRHFDNKESHWRYRFIAEYTPHLVGKLYGYVKLQPRWSLKDAGVKFDARDQLGITYKAASWKITPFIERNSTEGYNKKMTVAGIHWEANI